VLLGWAVTIVMVVALVLGVVRASRALGPLPMGMMATASLVAGAIDATGVETAVMAGGTPAPTTGDVTAEVTAGARRTCRR
jgi:hypothetical protein